MSSQVSLVDAIRDRPEFLFLWAYPGKQAGQPGARSAGMHADAWAI
jgi:hypothetical protein